MGILALQFLLVNFLNAPSLTQDLLLAGALIIIWSLLYQVQKHTLSHFLVTLFWANILYGGIGMLIGYKLDQYFSVPQTDIKMHSISLNAALLNRMTAVMLRHACVPARFYRNALPVTRVGVPTCSYTDLRYWLCWSVFISAI
ncbi:hypothetical protein [Microbulbifer sp. 2205BS26-8]|uniref:hypothetical protein n=1 Tax=Microbulbifer sp. 2205BS26-8 TaxID=3064386 RepID=UPI00274000BB|nr:hypothetical protein [Microbulbifer sp. 2205BS26-8]MDP5208510.1 hypothetical protein [Microbulbifer sp. 2205BS26-8]